MTATGPDSATSLAEVREAIDHIDERIAAALRDREQWVRRAAAFKTSESAVRAPDRVEQVVANARARAAAHGASPDVAEGVYRAMIEAFIALELQASRYSRSEPRRD